MVKITEPRSLRSFRPDPVTGVAQVPGGTIDPLFLDGLPVAEPEAEAETRPETETPDAGGEQA